MSTPLKITQIPKTAVSASTILPQLASIQLKAWLTVPLYEKTYAGATIGTASSRASATTEILRLSTERHTNSLLNDPTCQFLVAWVRDQDQEKTGGEEKSEKSEKSEKEAEDGEEGKWKPISFLKYNVFHTREETLNRRDTDERRWSAASASTPVTTAASSAGGAATATAPAPAAASVPAINIPLVQDFWQSILAVRRHHSSIYGAHVSIDILATLPEYQGRVGAGRTLITRVLKDEADANGLISVLEASREGRRLYESVGFVEEDGGKWNISVDMGRWAFVEGQGGVDKGVDWREKEKEKEEKEKEKDEKDPGWYHLAVMVRQPVRK